MSSAHGKTSPRNRRRRRLPHEGGGHDAGMERWLLTYSDMITLLMALFIVMWAVSAVNQAKFSQLSASLHQAFGGKVLEKDKSVLDGQSGVLTGGKSVGDQASAAAAAQAAAAASREAQNLLVLKHQVDAYAKGAGLEQRLRTMIEERGLVVRLLTDDLLFETGEAVLRAGAGPVLLKVARLIERTHTTNDIRVEGNTDDVPISTAQFHSNWELSAARAAAVLERIRDGGIPQKRLSLAGYADQRPVASNATAAGRSLNRRVDLVVVRKLVSG